MYTSIVPECLVCRFDLMAGVNGQEGGLMYGFQVPMIAGMLNKSVENGVDMEIVNAILNMQCGAATPLSTELCVSFLKNLYKLEEPISDRERAKRLIDMQGKTNTTLSLDLCPLASLYYRAMKWKRLITLWRSPLNLIHFTFLIFLAVK